MSIAKTLLGVLCGCVVSVNVSAATGVLDANVRNIDVTNNKTVTCDQKVSGSGVGNCTAGVAVIKPLAGKAKLNLQNLKVTNNGDVTCKTQLSGRGMANCTAGVLVIQ
ncbi:MAG: hypothetical protein K6L74_17180 [Neptuniibacter sp.]